MSPVFHLACSICRATRTFVASWRKLLRKVERGSTTLSNKFWLCCSFFIKLTTCRATNVLVRLLARRPSSRPKGGQFSEMGDFRPQATLPAAINTHVGDYLWGWVKDHAPSNSVRRSHGCKCYCNRLIVFCSVQAKSGGHYNKIAIWCNNMSNHRNIALGILIVGE